MDLPLLQYPHDAPLELPELPELPQPAQDAEPEPHPVHTLGQMHKLRTVIGAFLSRAPLQLRACTRWSAGSQCSMWPLFAVWACSLAEAVHLSIHVCMGYIGAAHARKPRPARL